jgi:hypothetical protein
MEQNAEECVWLVSFGKHRIIRARLVILQHVQPVLVNLGVSASLVPQALLYLLELLNVEGIAGLNSFGEQVITVVLTAIGAVHHVLVFYKPTV